MLTIISVLFWTFLALFCCLDWIGKWCSFDLFFSEWELISVGLIVEQNTSLFLTLLLLVFSSILLFTCYYIVGESFFSFFLITILVFVGSMVLLLLSQNLIWLLVSWDLLGVSSFLLVNYNLTWESTNSAINTVLSNRVGDFFLFLMLVVWLQTSTLGTDLNWVSSFAIFSLFLAAFTNSAQFPFSGWLPKAIAAPTPISALVHSSTLVTAGLLLLLKFGGCLLSVEASVVLFWSGLLTMTTASLSALVEEDVNKVVALSTLSQLGLAATTLGFGFLHLAFIHLVSHGFFNSLLFIQVGYLMHQSSSQQDPRDFLYSGRVSTFVQLQLLVSLFSLCGLFFSNGLVTNDLLLEAFWGSTYGSVVCLIFFFSVFLTFFYSLRVWKALFATQAGPVGVLQSGLVFNYLSLVLVTTSIMFLWWLNLNLLTTPGFFAYSDFLVPLVFLVFFSVLFFFDSNLKNSGLVSKFFVDYLLLSARWFVIDFNKIDSFGFKMDSSFVLFSQTSSAFFLSFIQTSMGWIALLVLLVFVFWW